MADRRLPSEQEVRACLDAVKDPCSVACGRAMGLSEMGLVDHVDIGGDGKIDIHLRLTSPACYMLPFLERESIRAVGGLPGVTAVVVHPDEGLDWTPERIAQRLRPTVAPFPRDRAEADA